jgi:predicted nuclease with TOPRIM domain
MEEIDGILECYEPGRPENKPDVIKELETIRKRRETLIKEEMDKQSEYYDTINKINMMSDPKILQQKVNEQSSIIQQLTIKNTQLEDKVNYLEKKLFQCMNENILYKNENKKDKNDNDVTTINVVNLTSSDPNISYSTL